MGLFSSSQNKKEKIVAIFDIGSGSVGGAIVSIPKDGVSLPTILKSVRSDIKSGSNLDFNHLMGNMLEALHQASDSLFHKKGGSPDEIFCVLASPWYISETRTIKMERSKTFAFKRKLADKLIGKEIANLNDLYKEKYKEEGAPDIIEQHILSVMRDGVRDENPLGKKCNSISMNMIVSLSPFICINKIKETISRTFHNTNIKFSSFTISSYLAIRDKYISDDSYLLIDIGGEITDIGMVIDGILRHIVSFPFGKKTFYKHICDKLEIGERESRELISLYNDGNLFSSFNKKVVSSLKSIENSWREYFTKSVSLFPDNIKIPNTVFLTADEDIKKCFTEVIGGFKVEALSGRDFLDMCSIEEGSCDPFLMIESIAIMRKITK